MPGDILDSRGRAPLHDARIPVLDGVRGLAILLILLVHFTPDYVMPNRALEWAKKLAFAGWTGVDLFFVLSGFLITNILLRVRGTNGWIRDFYIRRSLRILPLYLGYLVLVFGILPLVITPGRDPSFDAMQSIQGWFWVHAANIGILLHGFAATMNHTASLAHMWSLAVEEHFYLLWPFLVAKFPERRLFRVLLGIVAVAFCFRIFAFIFFTGPMLTAAFVQTPARMDGLAIGALLSLLIRSVPGVTLRRWALGALSLTGVLIMADFFLRKGLWPGSSFVRLVGFPLFAIFYASLIVLLLTATTNAPLRCMVDNAPLRFLGKYSYGIYVTHGLIPEHWFSAPELLARLHSPVLASIVYFGGKTAVAIAFALISWRLIEAPFLRLKDRFTYGEKTNQAPEPAVTLVPESAASTPTEPLSGM